MTTSAQRFDKGPGRAPRIAAGRVGLLGLLSLGCLAGTASAQATFRILGPGSASRMTPDGQGVVGFAGGAWLWTSTSGITPLGGKWGTDLSDDASVVIGNAKDGAGIDGPAVWTAASGWKTLGGLPGQGPSNNSWGEALGVSGDGLVVVGESLLSTGSGRAFRWDAGSGMVDLTPAGWGISVARTVSDDGKWIGGGVGPGLTWVAALWDAGLNLTRPLIRPENPNGFGQVHDINRDGSICVGYEVLGFDYVVPFRWKAGQGVLQLGQAAGTYPYLEQTYAYATSEDGNVVAGSTFNWLGPGPNFRATIWTPATGNVLLESYLWFLGVQELDPAYRHEAATDVSADGTKVIGRGLTPLFGHFWWEATLPICNGGTAGFCVTSPNSVGSGARIGSNGHVFIPFNSFELSVTGMPAHARGFFLYGPQPQQVPFGNGFSCVAPGGVGTFRLLPPFQSDAGGNAVRTLDFSQLAGAGQIVPGSTWYFQAWYRDPAAGGAGFNLSDGLEADFCD